MATNDNAAVLATVIASQLERDNAPAEGFLFGLMGSAVKDKDSGAVTDYLFATQVNGKTVSISNCEAPYPVSEDAALLAAETCKTSVWVYEDGEYKQIELRGIAAAVTIAIGLRRDESFRARLRSGKYNADTIRKDASGTYGFNLPDATDRKVAEEDVAKALQSADPIAALRALGINIASASKEGAE